MRTEKEIRERLMRAIIVSPKYEGEAIAGNIGPKAANDGAKAMLEWVLGKSVKEILAEMPKTEKPQYLRDESEESDMDYVG